MSEFIRRNSLPFKPSQLLRDDNLDIRHAILRGPILLTMLRLAWPTILVLVAQVAVGVAEIFYVSFLGTTALAGVALVFPLVMLMTMMSNGALGGGVGSAIARAIGARRMDDADALTLHALIIAIVFGLIFTAVILLFGRTIYAALGGTGAILDAAVTYSEFVFIGAVPSWIISLLAGALRGAGNVKVPALVMLVSAIVLVVLSPALIFGLGPLPHLGIAGAGTAVTSFNVLATIVLISYMGRGRSTPVLKPVRLQARLFSDVLGVGLLSAIGTAQFNLTVLLITGAVGLFGAGALAGYGIASRLDYLLIPLLFGLGTAVVTMVGTNIGAGAVARAWRIAWTGAMLAAITTEVIGVFVAVLPKVWLGLFTEDASVLATGIAYLQIVGPSYGAVGFGLLLYFAGQGAGRVLWPVLGGTARLLIAAVFGWAAVAWLGFGERALFALVAVAGAAYGGWVALATYLQSWGIKHTPIKRSRAETVLLR